MEAESFYGIVGKSEAVKNIVSIIKKIADSEVNVLITGDTGTGKEMVARAIHEVSNRKDGPMVVVNCSAVPDTLMESELFGYEKGAFTGAVSKKKGKFEMAQEGTLFLDEIGDMSLISQAKLLRVTEEKQIEHLGGTNKISINRRILAATSKNLEEEIGNERFRQDLFHRLDEINVHLPPLRERKEDIPLLAGHFVKLFCEKMGIPEKKISDSSFALLQRYEWPGNVRELRNVMKKTVLLSEEDTIWIEQLPINFKMDTATGKEWGIYQKKLVPLQEIEKDYIIHVLHSVNNNKKRAAEILGIDRTSLYNKINRYRIQAKK